MVNAKKPLSVVLALLIALSAVFALGIGTMTGASAAAGDTVYFEKPDGWGTPNCYAWGGTSGKASEWPGEAMTLVSGNTYKYTMPGDQVSVIFNNGNDSHQTGNLDYDGAKNYFTPSSGTGASITGTWSVYDASTDSTDAPAPIPSSAPTARADAQDGTVAYAYLNNEANWSKVCAHYWNGSGTGTSWPGVEIPESSKNADGYYEVVIPAEYLDSTKSKGGIIFNNGSGTQSADLRIAPGESMLYNNSTKAWEAYDSGPLKIMSFEASLQTPQYMGTEITLAASAVSEAGSVQYQFSVSGAENKTLQAYSTKSSVVWKPLTAGSYTITVDVKDNAGNTNSREMAYVIKDDTLEKNVVLKGISPTSGSTIRTKQTASVNVNASGGHVGTNLLFYKVAIMQDSTKKIVNGDVYYSLKNNYSFTPAQDGKYIVTVSVQNSNNQTVTRDYELFATSSEADLVIQSFSASTPSTVTVDTEITFTAAANGGKQPYQYQFAVNGAVTQAYSTSAAYTFVPTAAGSYEVSVTAKDAAGKTATQSMIITATDEEFAPGDVNMDGTVNLLDAILTQKASLRMVEFTPEQTKLGDVDNNGTVNLRDAVLIQKMPLHMAG